VEGGVWETLGEAEVQDMGKNSEGKREIPKGGRQGNLVEAVEVDVEHQEGHCM
jgi:hypothetical protein